MHERSSRFSQQVLSEEIDLAGEYDDEKENDDGPTYHDHPTSKKSPLVHSVDANMDINSRPSIRSAEASQIG